MAVITPLKALAQPTAATLAKAISLAGPMGDVLGLQQTAILDTQELVRKLQLIAANTDAADPNLAVINTAITTLS